MKPPLRLLFPRMSSSSSPPLLTMLQSITLVAFCRLSPVSPHLSHTRSTRTKPNTPDVPHQSLRHLQAAEGALCHLPGREAVEQRWPQHWLLGYHHRLTTARQVVRCWPHTPFESLAAPPGFEYLTAQSFCPYFTALSVRMLRDVLSVCEDVLLLVRTSLHFPTLESLRGKVL